MIRILKVYLKGKHKLLNKLSHKRFMGLLSKSNGIDDKCLPFGGNFKTETQQNKNNY
jgi:hypothetical protein